MGQQGELTLHQAVLRGTPEPQLTPPPARRAGIKAYLLISPAMVLFIAFIAVPVIGIVVFSFLQWDLLTPPKFAGLPTSACFFMTASCHRPSSTASCSTS